MRESHWIGSLLQEVTDILGVMPEPPQEDAPEEEHLIAREIVLSSLDLMFGLLFDAARAAISPDIAHHSVKESLVIPSARHIAGMVRLRPKNDYYRTSKTTLAVPRPENETGQDATGIEFSLRLMRGHLYGEKAVTPNLAVSFHIWGEHEREAFSRFYGDHSAVIRQLLSGLPLEFWTACVFPAVDREGTLHGRIGRYLMEEDEESSFDLSATFRQGALGEVAARCFFVLLSLYDSCYYYCIGRKKASMRILDYYTRLKPTHER